MALKKKTLIDFTPDFIHQQVFMVL